MTPATALDRVRTRPRRRFAAAAGLVVPVGALVMLVALVAAPGPWLPGYVSEAGTADQPLAVAYRSGLVLLALGVALLGVAFAPAVRWAGMLLGAAAVLAGTSGAVACSERCPLPPFEPTTPADVVHAAASIAGMVLLAAAMLVTAVSTLRPALRRLAAGAVLLTVPLGGALGLTMLFAGRGTLGSVLERVLLVVAVSWLTGTAVLAAAPAHPPHRGR